MGIIVPALRILGSLTRNREYLIEMLKENNLMEGLEKVLMSDKKVIRTEACWVLSNIAAGSLEDVNFLLSHEKLVGKLILLFETDIPAVRAELAVLFSNLTLEGKKEFVF